MKLWEVTMEHFNGKVYRALVSADDYQNAIDISISVGGYLRFADDAPLIKNIVKSINVKSVEPDEYKSQVLMNFCEIIE